MSQPLKNPEEADTLSAVHDDLLEGLEEALRWAKGETELCTIVRSTEELQLPATKVTNRLTKKEPNSPRKSLAKVTDDV